MTIGDQDRHHGQGRHQQIGTPDEILHLPENTFVGRFRRLAVDEHARHRGQPGERSTSAVEGSANISFDLSDYPLREPAKDGQKSKLASVPSIWSSRRRAQGKTLRLETAGFSSWRNPAPTRSRFSVFPTIRSLSASREVLPHASSKAR